MTPPEELDRIRTALERVRRWMRAHEAGVLVDNLAEGATPSQLAEYEAALGFAIPSELRALWTIHAGQRDEQNGFLEHRDLLGPVARCTEREDVAIWLGYLRAEPDTWDEASIREEEATSDQWIPVASRNYDDLVAVSAVTGRVFTFEKDSPPLRLVAGSVVEWLEDYADGVEAGRFVVEEGFGECFLANTD